MRNMLGEIEVDNVRYFEELNFQSSQLIDDIAEWLTDPAGLPLVLQGDPGSGRKYCLQAACYNQQFFNRPWTVVSIDWAQQGCQEPQQLLDWLAKHRRIKKKQFDLLAELVDSFNLDKSPIVLTNLTVFILSNLPNAINLGRKLLAACSISGKALPDQDSMRLLRYLLESILPTATLFSISAMQILWTWVWPGLYSIPAQLLIMRPEQNNGTAGCCWPYPVYRQPGPWIYWPADGIG